MKFRENDTLKKYIINLNYWKICKEYGRSIESIKQKWNWRSMWHIDINKRNNWNEVGRQCGRTSPLK
jgi:hypothetical protein